MKLDKWMPELELVNNIALYAYNELRKYDYL